MTTNVEAKLKELGIELPAPSEVAGNYLPYVTTGNLVFLSGQIPIENGTRKFVGKVGRDISVADAQKAAALCVVNLLAKLKIACGGDLDRVTRCVKVVGFVNATSHSESPSKSRRCSRLAYDAGRQTLRRRTRLSRLRGAAANEAAWSHRRRA